MKELVEVIAKALVDDPSQVTVEEVRDGKAPDDMGKVIGKQGRIAKAIRAVVKAASTRDHTHVDVEIA